MSAAPAMGSDMLVIVKSREVQRATLAEMRGDRKEAAKHFLAAAHLELVLADDYAQAGQPELALRRILGRGYFGPAAWAARIASLSARS